MGQGPVYDDWEAALLRGDESWMGSFGDQDMIARAGNMMQRVVLVVDPRTVADGRVAADCGGIQRSATMHTLTLPCSLLVRGSTSFVRRLYQVLADVDHHWEAEEADMVIIGWSTHLANHFDAYVRKEWWLSRGGTQHVATVGDPGVGVAILPTT